VTDAPVAAARILPAGYRRYDGPRLGPRHALWALWRHTLERMMGLRRPARYKVLPFLSLLLAYLPAVAFIGLVAILPTRRLATLVPDPGQYFPVVGGAVGLFAVLVAPEALCPDKRSKFLGIYLASPLSRTTYLLAKAAALGSVMLFVTLGPPLLLLVGEALQNAGPRGLPAFMGTLGQIVLAGLALSALYGSIALAVPSLTDRRGLASFGGILLFLGTGAVSGIVAFGIKAGDDWLLLALNRLPTELMLRIFDRHGLPTPSTTPLPTPGIVAAAIGVTLAAAAVTWWRVVATEVTR